MKYNGDLNTGPVQYSIARNCLVVKWSNISRSSESWTKNIGHSEDHFNTGPVFKWSDQPQVS